MTALLIRLIVIGISLASCSACAAKAPRVTGSVSVARQKPDLSGVLALIGGKGNMAHACPIGPALALTSAHVVGEDYRRYIWDSQGQIGLLGSPRTTERDLFRDLARVAPWGGSTTTFPSWYPLAKEAPQPGDKVHYRGWNFRRRKDAFAALDFESTVIRIRGGHVVYWPPGVPGTSGSCVLNAAGEVVAVNAFGQDLEDESKIGGAPGVWGDLLQLGQERAAR